MRVLELPREDKDKIYPQTIIEDPESYLLYVKNISNNSIVGFIYIDDDSDYTFRPNLTSNDNMYDPSLTGLIRQMQGSYKNYQICVENVN